MSLGDDEWHLYLIQCSAATAGGPLPDHDLSAEERERCQRYATAEMRHQALLTRLSVRRVLSRYQGVAPSRWVFGASELGRPHIDTPLTDLDFNLSHSRDWIVMAVSRNHTLGVDVEKRDRQRDILPVARRMFSPAEVAWLESLAADMRQHEFYSLWSLREAWLKARAGSITHRHPEFGFGLNAQYKLDCRGVWPDAGAVFLLEAIEGFSLAVAARMQTEALPRFGGAWQASDLGAFQPLAVVQPRMGQHPGPAS